MNDNWMQLPAGIDTPTVLIDVDVLERNITSWAQRLADRGVGLRPHTKTTKCVEVIRRQVAAGVVGLTVATLGEAEALADAGFTDLFQAYPVWAGRPERARRLRELHERVSLMVGVESVESAAALGAAVGGLATPIGTSPNVIAYGLIREAGLQVGFLEWAAVGLPVAVAVLLCGALVLRSLADGFRAWTPPARARRLPRPGLAGWTWCAVFLATVVLWSTQPWTAIPIERASLLPIVALPALGLVRAPELRAIDWRTLLLLFAGLVLGAAMGRTGVAAWLVGWSVPATAPDAVVVASFCAVSVVLSTFMSNTATANLLVPMALALGDPALALPCALASALGSSLAVGLPVSTPPMLLAHATGFVRPRELAMLGVVIGVLGTLAVTASIRLR